MTVRPKPNPRVHLRQFLDRRWDGQQMAEWSYYDMGIPRDVIRIHIGQYDADTPSPEVAIFKSHETVGGGTGAYGVDGSTGKAVQRQRNNIYVDAVAGTVDDCRGIGINGEDHQPQVLAGEMGTYIRQLVRTYEPFQGYDELSTLPGEIDGNFPDTDPDPEPEFRQQFRIRRFYQQRPATP